MAGLGTVIWRMEELLAILQRVEQAGVPNLVWLKGDLKARPAIGRNSIRQRHITEVLTAQRIRVRMYGQPVPGRTIQQDRVNLPQHTM